MAEKMIHSDGIELFTESFGDPTDTPLLLIMGAMSSMVYWDEEFCRKLANQGRFVIRYDNRDVGRSTCYEPGKLNYTVSDMADDILRIMDAYGLGKAHLIGMSLGGMLAQIAAIKYPERIQSITLISSGIIETDESREFPPMDERILAYHARSAELDWSDKAAVADYLVTGSRLLSGSKHSFDAERAAVQVHQEIERANNLLSMFNHALLESDESFQGTSKQVTVPVLIIHGTEDTILPYGHALALMEEIPHAKLVRLEGTGHELPAGDWDEIIKAITSHTAI
ncbi:alpha/beta hydrolase [Planococcus shenhongbingii]|uniref:alpha/beta fold hydrolase n=1 Tax=Planococcus shenhongbingii TaxID=3058398 RepID=UPI002638C638|nr:alpha/beta hydrolase [Planococcus sp. N016]WKA59402.1 alpha/beta hydrolase [Planococcus sp. N016]